MSPRASKPPSAAPAAKAKAKAPAGRARKPKPAASSLGIEAAETTVGVPGPAVAALAGRVAAIGGNVLATYREPLGGHWVVLAALPLARIAPTPYQRELSKTHADKLATVIPKVGRFLDPVIAVATPTPLAELGDGPAFMSPNGMHRLAALATLGARAVTALLVPEPEVAFRILALNTEKAHTLRDKALEVIRMARALVLEDAGATRPRDEVAFAFEFEQPALVTLGICYERNGRFSGGAYNPVLARAETFLPLPLADALATRAGRADRLIELDEAVGAAVTRLKDAGWQSGYLKPIVVARINPLRFVKPGGQRPDLDATLTKMLDGARAFDPSKVKAQDLAIAAMSASSAED
jgi:ParB family chromosome partitioning protein